MTNKSLERRHADLYLQSIERLSNIPVIESSINLTTNIYGKIKKSNPLISWSLDAVEQSLVLVKESTKPAFLSLNKVASTIDEIICRGIDTIELRVSSVNLKSQTLYVNTREYMNDKFVKPVIKRAGSVTHISSQAAAAAAETLDDAFTVADGYLDRYLPADPADKGVRGTEADTSIIEVNSKAARTFQHGARLSRKVQRRLTRRTLAEARALKNQGIECIYILIKVMKLAISDPKTAYRKSKELWAVLSLPEPENQERPKTLEQLFVLLARESARRIVHLINAATIFAVKSPLYFEVILTTISCQLLSMADVICQITSITCKQGTKESRASILKAVVKSLNTSTNAFLEKTAIFLAGRPEPEKLTSRNHNNHLSHGVNRPLNDNKMNIH